MAEETKKSTTTTKKRTTTSKPKVEEPKPQLSIEEQMAQMMAMMMAQQQQLMELMAKNQQRDEPIDEVVEVVEKPKNTKRVRKDGRRTKQDLRHDYKNVDIYLTNVSSGLVAYNGRNMRYEWRHTGDVEVVTIDDIINMPKIYLKTPWLCLDAYENDAKIIDDIVSVLGLKTVYEYIYILQDMDEDINHIEIDEVQKAIELSNRNGYDISMDLVILIDRKIRSGELNNYVFIGELEKLLGRKFL